MSLERRISEALHATDSFEPSLDLFSRLHQSIEEDKAHRRRMRKILASSLALAVALTVFLGGVASRNETGEIELPRWALEVSVAIILVAVLIALGPILRRLGRPLLDEVFHLSPGTGVHFSKLLELGYYLFFGGVIVLGVDPTSLFDRIPVSDDRIWEPASLIAPFLARLGIAHFVNLAVLPFIGLLFTSAVRRSRRQKAGAGAPPMSARARQADRLATGLMFSMVAVSTAGVLVTIAVIIVVLGLG
jgi:hypothetical protein